jgi:hypothetical protein
MAATSVSRTAAPKARKQAPKSTIRRRVAKKAAPKKAAAKQAAPKKARVAAKPPKTWTQPAKAARPEAGPTVAGAAQTVLERLESVPEMLMSAIRDKVAQGAGK